MHILFTLGGSILGLGLARVVLPNWLPSNEFGSWATDVASFVDGIALIALYSCIVYLIVAKIMSKATIHENFVNAVTNRAGPPLRQALTQISECMVAAINAGRLAPVIYHRTGFSSEFRKRFLDVGGVDLDNGNLDDEQLSELTRLYREGDIKGAIERLRPFKGRSEKHMDEFLSMLCCSLISEFMQEAHDLIDKNGQPHHFNALAFSEWREGNAVEAIRLARQGLAKLATNGDADVKAALQNSLAYYYADHGAVEHREEAFHLAEEALRSRQDGKQSSRLSYGDALDTLGYVMIQFGTDVNTIQKGIRNCTNALIDYGVEKDLYDKHTRRGSERLNELHD